jgi:hypothetical protein
MPSFQGSVLPNGVKHFVAKLVKSFGRLGNAAESLDDLSSFQGSALERTAFEAPPRVSTVHNSGGRCLRCIASPGRARGRVQWNNRSQAKLIGAATSFLVMEA